MHLDTPKNKATIMSVRMPFYKKVYETLTEAVDTNSTLRGEPPCAYECCTMC